jgi:hypothetical protein
MKAKPYSLITVRMPPDLHSVLEALSAEKGESVSCIVREMVRQVAAGTRRVDNLENLCAQPNAGAFR